MIFHRGREMAHQEVGRAKMTRLLGEIADFCQIETMPRMEGNVLVALLAPKKGVDRRRQAWTRRRATRSSRNDRISELTRNQRHSVSRMIERGICKCREMHPNQR